MASVEVVDLVIKNEGQRLSDDSFLAVGALVVAYYVTLYVECLDSVEVMDLVIRNEGQRLADDSFLAVGALVVAYYVTLYVECLDSVEVMDLVIRNEGQRLSDDSFLAVGALVVAYYRMECDGCMVPVHTLDLSLNNSILGRVSADCRELLLLPRCSEEMLCERLTSADSCATSSLTVPLCGSSFFTVICLSVFGFVSLDATHSSKYKEFHRCRP